MKIGVVGGGKWGQNIIRTLNSLGVLGGVADEWGSTREQVAASYPEISVVESVDELLALGVDAVAIATPAPVHFELGKKVLEAGKHCFIEKPMTLSSTDARTLCEMADAASLTLMVGHLLIYQPAIEFLKKSIDEGMIGELAILNHERLGLGRARDVENVLWSLGVHDIAVCQFLVGGSEIVDCGMSGMAALQPGIEDDTRLWMKFENGAIGHIHNSWLWPERRRMLTVVGTKAMLVYDELAQTVTLHKKSVALPSLENVDEGEELVFEGAGQPLTLEMEHFMSCIQTGSKPNTDGWSGLQVVEVMERVSPMEGI